MEDWHNCQISPHVKYRQNQTYITLQRVELAKEIYFWPIHIICNQYVKNAIYAPYVRDFVQDTVGISPSDTSVHKYQDGIFGKLSLL